MMTALINVQGDITKLPLPRTKNAGQYNKSTVSDYFANKGIDVSTLKPAMETLGKMAGGTGVTAMDHL
jgi:hypothetical protein